MTEFGQRLVRAHGNSIEYLALPVGLMLLAMITGNGAITDDLALVYLGARILQSVSHMISTSSLMVMVRGTFFVPQLVILVIWAINLYGAG